MVKILPTVDNKKGQIKNLIPFSLHKRSIWRSLKYQKLPAQLLKLSVVKLDGSSFSLHAPRNSTVARLKIAIEEEFNLSQDDKGKMLWPLVWNHFCLCYGGQKLMNEKASIESYGIKDGDQLHFVQHLRTDYAAAALQSSQNDHAKIHKATNVLSQQRFGVSSTKISHSLKDLLSCSKFRSLKRLSFNLVKADRG